MCQPTGLASAIGLLQGEEGISGIVANKEFMDSFIVQLWGLRECLLLAEVKRLVEIVTKMDTALVVSYMNKDGNVEGTRVYACDKLQGTCVHVGQVGEI